MLWGAVQPRQFTKPDRRHRRLAGAPGFSPRAGEWRHRATRHQGPRNGVHVPWRVDRDDSSDESSKMLDCDVVRVQYGCAAVHYEIKPTVRHNSCAETPCNTT